MTDTGNSAIRKVTSAGVVTTLVLQQTSALPVIPVPASSGATGTTGSTTTASGSASGGGAIGPSLACALLAAAALRRRQLSRPMAPTRYAVTIEGRRTEVSVAELS